MRPLDPGFAAICDALRRANRALGRGTLTRRQFLAAAGSTAAALAGCSRPPILRSETPSDAAQVIVVGGGLAGLTCAYRLKRAGVRVRVFEAQGRLGGRVLTLRDFFPEGQTAELGGEFVSSGDRSLITLAEELGVALDDRGEEILLDPIHWHFEGRSRSREEVVHELRPIVEKVRRDLAERRHDGPVFYQDPNGLEALDQTPLSAWLDAAGATGWIRRLVETVWTAEFGVECDRQSALNLVLGLDDEVLHSGASGDRRYRIRGGSDRLVEALAKKLENEIEVSSPVEAIRELPSWSWSVSVRRDGSSLDVEAAHLVLAVPFPLLREIEIGKGLPKIKQYAMEHLAYGSTTKLAIGFGERAWRRVYQTRATVVSDAGFQSAWEAPPPAASTRGVLVVQAGGERGLALGAESLQLQAESVLAGLDVVFPSLSTTRADGRAARLGWSTHPWERGSRPFYAPHQWTLFGGVQAERIGRLHFAGDHTSHAALGTMEGAVESADRVAREILSR